MNSILNRNQLTIVKGYEFIEPLIQKVDSITDNCYRGCHNKYYHTFEYKCEYDIRLRIITKIEIIDITISDKSMSSLELKKTESCSTKRFCI